MTKTRQPAPIFPDEISEEIMSPIMLANDNTGKQNMKFVAISFLDAFQREYDGVMTPNYSAVSKITNCPESTLRNWWSQKDAILRLHRTYLDALPKLVALRIGQECLNIVEVIAKRGYKKMSIRDLTALFSQYTQKFRLLTGQSTSNIDVHNDYNPVLRRDVVSGSKGNKVVDADIISESEENSQE
jgi:hypothetical protein